MYGKKLSNLLVWWIVPSLFVVNAAQCGYKKKANGPGPANSADGSYEMKNSKSGESDVSGTDVMKNSKSGGSDVSGTDVMKNSKSGGSDVSGTDVHPDQQQSSLKAIDEICGELVVLFKGKIYEDFLNDELPRAGYIDLWGYPWHNYYRPLARIWMYLEQQGLSSIKEVRSRLSGNTVDGLDLQGIFSDLLKFLSDSGWENLEYAVEKSGQPNYSWSLSNFFFHYRLNGFRYHDDNLSSLDKLVQHLQNQMVVGSGSNEYPITSDEFGKNLEEVADWIRGNGFLVWYNHNLVGRLTLALTKLEWHLKKLFGENFDKYRKAPDGSNSEYVLDSLISFYQDTYMASIEYTDLPKMGFDQLRAQVEAALKRTQNSQS